MKLIPVYKPYIKGNEKKYISDCIDTTWISSRGNYINRFEKYFSDYLNINHATSVTNGTAALHLALCVLGIKAGDEVIVPTLTYIASVNAIQYIGATPVFVDSEEEFWNIDVDKIEEKISTKTKAILAVHLYGASCEMSALSKICKEHNLFLIEDAAEAFGTKYAGKYAGSFGDISTFSFFGNKTITTGEGGMLVSKNKELIERAAYLKSQAVSSLQEYWHDDVGYNYRMTNISAAIGVAQLEQADKILQLKKKIAMWYKYNLEGTNIVFQPDVDNRVNSYWMISVLVESEALRDLVRTKLLSNNIETRPFFFPAHVMPVFKENNRYPIAESISKRGISLPSYPGLSKKEVLYVCNIIKELL